MKIKTNILEGYYQYIEDTYCYKTLDELLGKRYVVGKEFGTGDFSRMKIEDGLEISKINMDKMEMDFDNTIYNNDILEVGYCYSGEIRIIQMPDNKEYVFKQGDIFIYKMLNDVEYFKFIYNKSKAFSIHMDFYAIKNAINPIWEDKLIVDWQKNINQMFKENILIIQKANYNIKKIADSIDSISIDSMMGYMKLKFKTVEFLSTVFEEKFNENLLKDLKNEEIEWINDAKSIINRNLEDPPSLKELASDLDMSVYKLQKGFKEMLGSTVYQYIKKVRIEKAKYLLKNTDMSIIEISNEIGYENPSKFANLFKEYNDMTPSKYRKIQEKI